MAETKTVVQSSTNSSINVYVFKDCTSVNVTGVEHKKAKRLWSRILALLVRIFATG